ncbi:uncharacterized protein LOC122381826 [Amphibalanus amphitrite]|uniref:uncharacterized protein LOC122381826 n=1 Tax=Amphibalanus amphitrite TaxID=1232801 RepID=UPI001C92B02F|nr:uncharacterized protein LOC122381826 [Amphibalanus amphitrite]
MMDKRDVSRSIVCICTTLECQQAGVSTCTTTGMCYTQQLRRLDGADPMTRGCVRGETPLMCDHLLPTHGEDYRASSICCGTPLCNKQVSLASGRGRGPGGTRRHEQHEQRRTSGAKHDVSVNRTLEALLALGGRQGAAGWRPGPLVISVLAVGLAMVVGISAAGIYILQSNRFVAEVPFSACPRDHVTS